MPPPIPPVHNQTPPPEQSYYYVTGLDPNGYNWLALRSAPSYSASFSTTHMAPGTLVTVLDRSGDFAHVRLQSGEEGWAGAKFLACCTTASGRAPSQRDDKAEPVGRYYYVTGLDPKGYNWLALRSAPSYSASFSETHMPPGTRVTVLGRSGDFAHVRLKSGEEGWAGAKYLACCVGRP